jgi:hypothetical protein
LVESNCDRCGQKTQEAHFMFHEVDKRDAKHRFGIFCIQCTIELLEDLKGKLEWFYIEGNWRGYIHPKDRYELEKAGFVHSKHNSQYIEISQVGRKHKEVERKEALAILRVGYAGGLISKGEYEKLLKELKEAGH